MFATGTTSPCRPTFPSVPPTLATRGVPVGVPGTPVQTANRYAERGDFGDETGEHFGARIGAELFPSGAFPGAVRLPSITISLH